MNEQGRPHYYHRRAEEERAAAQRATNERAAQAHRELADRYGQLAAGSEQIVHERLEPETSILPKDFRIVP